MGTENGLMLLDRSGQGKVYNLITRRRFLQMDVLEGLNVLVTISGNSHRHTHIACTYISADAHTPLFSSKMSLQGNQRKHILKIWGLCLPFFTNTNLSHLGLSKQPDHCVVFKSNKFLIYFGITLLPSIWSHSPSVPPLPGKKNKLRVYYLSWLRNRILHNDPEVEKKQGWITVGELEGCVHYKVGKNMCVCVFLYLILIKEQVYSV